LITTTVSPSVSGLPLLSRKTLAPLSGAAAAATVFDHSWPHSAQTKFEPSS
jgi:hypothetical protein